MTLGPLLTLLGECARYVPPDLHAAIESTLAEMCAAAPTYRDRRVDHHVVIETITDDMVALRQPETIATP